MAALVRRYARTHGPFPTAQITRRFGLDLTAALKRARARRRARPRGVAAGWHGARVVRLRRAAPGPARERRGASPGGRGGRPGQLARFLPAWQNVDAHRPAGAGPDRLREALIPLQGVALTPEVWERDVLPRRLGAYSPTWIDQLTTSGEIVWIGAGALARTGTRRALLPRGCPPLRPAAVEREARPPRGAGPRCDPRAAGRSAVVLARPGRRARGRARGASCRALGSRLGRRGHQRRVRAVARPPADRGRARSPAGAPLRLPAQPRAGGDRRALVVDREPVPRRTGRGPAPARPG